MYSFVMFTRVLGRTLAKTNFEHMGLNIDPYEWIHQPLNHSMIAANEYLLENIWMTPELKAELTELLSLP